MLSFLVLGVLFEMYLRFAGIGTPSLMVSDRVMGRVLRPDVRLVLLNEGFFMGRINKYGYFGPGYGPEKPENTFRIALVGDSFVAGFHILGRHHFRTVLENQLRETTGKNIQVMNFGIAGYNFEKMYIYDRLYIQKFNPDLVLFFVGQDDFTEIDEKVGPVVLVEEGKPVIKFGFLQKPAFRRTQKVDFLRESAFYSLHKASLGLFLRGETGPIVLEKLYPASQRTGEEQVPLTPERDRINRAILKEMAENDSGGIVFVKKRPLPASTQQMLEEYKMPVLDPHDELERLRQQGIGPNDWPLTGRSGHWNYYGHKAVGMFLAEKILAMRTEQWAGKQAL